MPVSGDVGVYTQLVDFITDLIWFGLMTLRAKITAFFRRNRRPRDSSNPNDICIEEEQQIIHLTTMPPLSPTAVPTRSNSEQLGSNHPHLYEKHQQLPSGESRYIRRSPPIKRSSQQSTTPLPLVESVNETPVAPEVSKPVEEEEQTTRLLNAENTTTEETNVNQLNDIGNEDFSELPDRRNALRDTKHELSNRCYQFRLFLHIILEHAITHWLIALLILLNTIFLATEHHNQVSDTFNHVMTHFKLT